MTDIYILTDYKGYFGSKQKSEQYKSGMQKSLLSEYFTELGFNAIFISFTDIDFRKNNYNGKFMVYTSSEDPGYYYKDFIEDIIFGLELQGAKLIPAYKFLRANNNKILMEILRDLSNDQTLYNISSSYFGTIKKLQDKLNSFKYPVVIKTAGGAMSTGVYLAKNKKELLRFAKLISRSRNWWKELWDIKNYIKHGGKLILNSRFRKKFIVQNFIPGLKNDWKILIYGNKYYVLNRKVRKNDFRASGSGLFNFEKNLPNGLLEFANAVVTKFNLPQLSLDVAFDGENFILIELQALYFGTKTIEYAPFYFKNEGNDWNIIEEKSILEKVYAESICNFIKQL